MERVVVTVGPVQGGWSVVSPLSAGPLMFLSASDAERQALWFAKLAASQGWDAELWFHHLAGDVSVRAYAANRMVPPMARSTPGQHPSAGADSRLSASGRRFSRQD